MTSAAWSRMALSVSSGCSSPRSPANPQHPHDGYGLLSYSELLQAIVAEEGDVDLLNVYDAAVKPVVTVGEDLSVNQAAALMTRFRLNRLVVVQGNELIGLLAMNDIISRLIDELA